MKKIRFFFTALVLLLVTTSIAFAQRITVSGTVTDAASGDGLVGVSVLLKGSATVYTMTDALGNYKISVPSDGTLVFNTLGYQSTEIAVNGQTTVNAVLTIEAEALDEVIMVAYGTAKKSSFTGSATTVKSESLQKHTVSNVSKAVEGLVAGVTTTSGGGQPGSNSSIQVRGVGSINASSSPLYVVDGVPYDGALAAINPNDIENLTVLKDASASALYGARAANGVILITTKKGAEGSASVNFKAQWGVQSRSLPRYDVVNMEEFVELSYEAIKNDLVFKSGYTEADARLQALANLSSSLGGEYYNPYKNYTWATVIDPETGKVKSDAVAAYSEDWMDELTNKNALRSEYLLSLTGGTAKTKYTLSLGYLDDNGVLITTNFKRYSARVGVDHSANNWFKIGTNSSFAYTTTNSPQHSDTQTGNAWYTAQFMAPIYPVYMKDIDGNTVYNEDGTKRYDYAENGRPKANNFNAVGDLYENSYLQNADNASVRAYAIFGGDSDDLGALKGLTFSVNFGTDIRNLAITSYYNPYTGDGRSTSGSIRKYARRTMSYTSNEILKYERSFGAHHGLIQAGHEFYSYDYSNLSAQRTLVYPGIKELDPATNVTDNGSYSDKYRLESYFGRAAYDFDDKYYLEATWRTDGSSRFYKDYHWGQFWSAGASWRVSQEKFMQNLPWVNNLTARISYGQLGNDRLYDDDDNPIYYAWQSFYDLTWPNAGNSGAVVSSLENKDVTWEKKSSWNVGIDATLFDQKINLVLEYYNSKTTDMLLNSPLAMSTGFTGFNANMGSMSNKGLEASIRYNWLNKSKLRASSTITAYGNRNKVIALNGDKKITTGNYVIEVGKPIYTYYMVKTAGVDPANGQQLYWAYEHDQQTGEKIEGSDYVTSDKTVASNAKYYQGSRQPKIQGSFSSDFQFGPVDFSFITTYSIGGKVYESVYAASLDATYSGDTWHKHVLRRWQKPGDVTDVPRIGINTSDTIGDRALIDASYFAIKSVQLGYTIPKSITNKVNISAARIFATAENLRLFNKLNGMDPQYNTTGGANYSYSPTKTIAIGVDLTF